MNYAVAIGFAESVDRGEIYGQLFREGYRFLDSRGYESKAKSRGEDVQLSTQLASDAHIPCWEVISRAAFVSILEGAD